MQTIYFKNRKLSLCRKEEIPPVADERFLLVPSADYDLAEIPFMMESDLSFQHLFVETPENMNESELFDKVFDRVIKLDAAGGLVEDPSGNYLMIYRNGVWDLPKGKREEGEDITVTALREVKEETGVDARLGDYLTTTRHTYRLAGNLVVKNNYWYRMSAPDGTLTLPQTEEGIQKCEWVTKEDLDYRLANTYPSILDVFDSVSKINNLGTRIV